MSLQIDFINETEEEFSGELTRRIQEALEKGIELEGVEGDCMISVSFVTPEMIQEYNRDYRKVDRVTDVLSFPVHEGLDAIKMLPGGMPKLLGDVILNPERAREQAESYCQSFEDEMEYLSIHSLLHLLGYDHMIEDEKKVMREHEKAILYALGVRGERL